MASSLAGLRALARQQTPGKRRPFLRALADTLLDPSSELNPDQRELLEGVIDTALGAADDSARQEFVARLEDGPSIAPRETVAARAAARPLDQVINLIAVGNLPLRDAVIELADADRVVDLAMLMCGSIGCDGFISDLVAPNEEPLMRTCRAALLDLNAFSAVLAPAPPPPPSVLRRRCRPPAARLPGPPRRSRPGRAGTRTAAARPASREVGAPSSRVLPLLLAAPSILPTYALIPSS